MGTQGCLFAIRRCAEHNCWTPQTIPGETVREAIGETAWQSIGTRGYIPRALLRVFSFV